MLLGQENTACTGCLPVSHPRCLASIESRAAFVELIAQSRCADLHVSNLDGQFEITGAGLSDANGKYSLTNPSGRAGRPEYTHTGNPAYKVQWSSMSSVWMLDNIHGPAPYMISGRQDIKFPWDAEWSVYQGGRLPVPATVYSKPESQVLFLNSVSFLKCGIRDWFKDSIQSQLAVLLRSVFSFLIDKLANT